MQAQIEPFYISRTIVSNYNLTIPLTKREDKNGKTYFMCKIKSPVVIDLSKGATFFIFASEEGLEEIQIAPFQDKPERDDKREIEIIQKR